MNTKCYLCESLENSNVFIENGTRIVKCKSCGHVFSTFEQKDHYEGYWGEKEATFDLDWWDLAHRDVYTEFIETFLKNDTGNILDVGCGLGFFVKAVREKRPRWNAIGYEMSASAVKFAKEKNKLKDIFSGQVEKSKLKKESFEIITLWDVIEHIPKPQPLLKYLHSLLKPGGILFVQTPNFPVQLFKAKLKVLLYGMKPNVHYLEAKDHINDYSERTLVKLSNQCGFESCEYRILKPILHISGGKSKVGATIKVLYYKITKWIWILSFKKINLNNTLFAILRK